jgi:hypothetical protein
MDKKQSKLEVRGMLAHGLQIRIVLGLILVFISPTIGSALSYGTPDSGFCHNMVSFLEIYEKQNEGRLPTSWADLDRSSSKPIDEIFYYLQPTKRYAILSPPVPLPRPLEGKLIVMTRQPYRDTELYSGWFGISRRLGKSGYRIVYKIPEGVFQTKFVSEDYIEEVFRRAESSLPEPDKELERSGVRNTRRQVLFRRIICCGLGFVVAAILWRRLRNRSRL